MLNPFVEGLFLLAFWAPPIAVVSCAFVVLFKAPSARRSTTASHAPAAAH
jgi:hypothetical protein